MPKIVTIILAVAFLAASAAAETILLNDRSSISAPVIKESPGYVYVDLGFDILKIPRDVIAGMDSPAAAAQGASAPATAARGRASSCTRTAS